MVPLLGSSTQRSRVYSGVFLIQSQGCTRPLRNSENLTAQDISACAVPAFAALEAFAARGAAKADKALDLTRPLKSTGTGILVVCWVRASWTLVNKHS